jgi:solute:Na+ symporter, SSS family
MQTLDYAVLVFYFLLVTAIGVYCFRKVKGSGDFYVAGGKIPWWLGGVSHHVSGYSGVVFVGLAAIAYEDGFTVYVWWAVSVASACVLGALWIGPRWARLRLTLGIESPTEYLAMRYNVLTQQIMAWCGVLLKLFDVGAKWASIGILLYGFTGLPITLGVLISGAISLAYITIGGLWADLYNDFLQFIVQVGAGTVLFIATVSHLGGMGSISGIWSQLPADHSSLFNGEYTMLFAVAFLIVASLSYNGGTWNLAARYIGAPSAQSARKTAMLSGTLYLVWPLVIFFPMWAAPLILPDLADPSQSYVMLARQFLPAGLVGLVLAAMFAATTSMTSSDSNTISSVVTRDILPNMSPKFRNMDQKRGLRIARLTTFSFMGITLMIGIEAERFGGVLGLIIAWFGALIGPVSVPMVLGLLSPFKHADARAAIISIFAGLAAFVIVTYGFEAGIDYRTLMPVSTSIVVFSFIAWLRRNEPLPEPIAALMEGLSGRNETKP